jgi:8-oxo-dGTP pyrophosphatase MutT (NUDIX family)
VADEYRTATDGMEESLAHERKPDATQHVMQLSIIKSLKKLSENLKHISGTETADAAVALLLKPANNRLSVLFVKRADSPNDPWSGQTALPGGKREPKDKSLKHTIIRETLEETNINLEHRCRFLGTTSIQHSNRSPEMRILPFVVLLEHEPTVKLNEKELEGFAWISMKELADHKGTVKSIHGELPAYIIDNQVIWGLTYRVIENFLKTAYS